MNLRFVALAAGLPASYLGGLPARCSRCIEKMRYSMMRIEKNGIKKVKCAVKNETKVGAHNYKVLYFTY
jgi:hypothetical protein